jgi:hypothetical protein
VYKDEISEEEDAVNTSYGDAGIEDDLSKKNSDSDNDDVVDEVVEEDHDDSDGVEEEIRAASQQWAIKHPSASTQLRGMSAGTARGPVVVQKETQRRAFSAVPQPQQRLPVTGKVTGHTSASGVVAGSSAVHAPTAGNDDMRAVIEALRRENEAAAASLRKSDNIRENSRSSAGEQHDDDSDPVTSDQVSIAHKDKGTCDNIAQKGAERLVSFRPFRTPRGTHADNTLHDSAAAELNATPALQHKKPIALPRRMDSAGLSAAGVHEQTVTSNTSKGEAQHRDDVSASLGDRGEAAQRRALNKHESEVNDVSSRELAASLTSGETIQLMSRMRGLGKDKQALLLRIVDRLEGMPSVADSTELLSGVLSRDGRQSSAEASSDKACDSANMTMQYAWESNTDMRDRSCESFESLRDVGEGACVASAGTKAAASDEIVLEVLSNWGHEREVGICELEVFDDAGTKVRFAKAQVWAYSTLLSMHMRVLARCM